MFSGLGLAHRRRRADDLPVVGDGESVGCRLVDHGGDIVPRMAEAIGPTDECVRQILQIVGEPSDFRAFTVRSLLGSRLRLTAPVVVPAQIRDSTLDVVRPGSRVFGGPSDFLARQCEIPRIPDMQLRSTRNHISPIADNCDANDVSVTS
jgi:hypothetical protein